MKTALNTFFKRYFEIAAFGTGLILLALMDPETVNWPTLCLFEQLGISFCPGDGLGHSISYIFRGEFFNAMKANILGPLTLIILSTRILHLLVKNNYNYNIKS